MDTTPVKKNKPPEWFWPYAREHGFDAANKRWWLAAIMGLGAADAMLSSATRSKDKTTSIASDVRRQVLEERAGQPPDATRPEPKGDTDE